VTALQYLLAVSSPDANFAPLEFAPPSSSGVCPDGRVLFCGELALMTGKNGGSGTNNTERGSTNNGSTGSETESNFTGELVWSVRHFDLLPRELVFSLDGTRRGCLFIDKAVIFDDDKQAGMHSFTIKSASPSAPISYMLNAETQEIKNAWLLALRKQIQFIENQKLKLKTCPKEEMSEDPSQISEKVAQFYDERWTAPAVEGMDDDYFAKLLHTGSLSSGSGNNKSATEFFDCEEPSSEIQHNNQQRKSDDIAGINPARKDNFGSNYSNSGGSPRSSTNNVARLARQISDSGTNNHNKTGSGGTDQEILSLSPKSTEGEEGQVMSTTTTATSVTTALTATSIKASAETGNRLPTTGIAAAPATPSIAIPRGPQGRSTIMPRSFDSKRSLINPKLILGELICDRFGFTL
jgi:hypothetical protein